MPDNGTKDHCQLPGHQVLCGRHADMTNACVSMACFVNTKCLQASLLLKIMAGHYAAIAGYSADLRSLVKRCLTQSPDRRPNTGNRALCFC